MIFQGSEFIELLSPQGSKPLLNWSCSPLPVVRVSKAGQDPFGFIRSYQASVKGLCFSLKNGLKFKFPADDVSTKRGLFYYVCLVYLLLCSFAC